MLSYNFHKSILSIALAHFLMLLYTGVNAQVTVGYQNCFGTSSYDYFTDAIKIPNDGYAATVVFSGVKDGFMDGDTLSYPSTLFRLNEDLTLRWYKKYGGDVGGSGFKGLVQTKDNGFLIGGTTQGSNGDLCPGIGYADILLVKTNELGDIMWQECYGSPGNENFQSITEVDSGSFIVAFTSLSSGGIIPFHFGDGFTYDCIAMKIDSLGMIVWVKPFGGSGDDLFRSAPILLENGHYLFSVVSNSSDFDLSDSDIEGAKHWVFETDSDGNIIRQNIFSGTEDLISDEDTDIIPIENNKYLMAGYANTASTNFPDNPNYGGGYDGCAAILDSNLNLIDIHYFGGSYGDFLKKVKRDALGNYYFLGYSNSLDFDLPTNYNSGAALDYWIMKVDNEFNVVWSRNFGGGSIYGDMGGQAFQGDFVVEEDKVVAFVAAVVPSTLPDFDIQCGNLGVGTNDAWLISFDQPTGIKEIESANHDFKLYPNPADDAITISLNPMIQSQSISIFASNGAKVFETFEPFQGETQLNIFGLANGLYFVEVVGSVRVYSAFFVKN